MVGLEHSIVRKPLKDGALMNNQFRITVSLIILFALSIFLFGIDSAKAEPFAYVANTASSDVSVIDTATNMVVGSPIPVGLTPFGVAVTPDGARVYVVNVVSSDVSVIDTVTNTVVATIMVGDNPIAVAITPPPLPTNVPTLSEWGLIAMAGILGVVGFLVIKRRKITA